MFDFIKTKLTKKIVKDKTSLEGCKHDPIGDDSTLVLGGIHTMVYPKEYQYVCRNCGKTFKYIEKDGNLVRTPGHDKG